MDTLPISLTMVACNEAHRLGPMLLWHRPLVSQIVIAVQESEDQTLEIARDMADVVLEHAAYGYCEASREAASQAARHDVQLILDADEWLMLAFIADLPRLIAQISDGSCMGYRLRRTFWRDGRHEFTGDAHYRLVNRRAVRFLNEIHTEPQARDWRRVPTWGGDNTIMPAILHIKTTQEQLADEERCHRLLSDGGALAHDPLRRQKLALNVHREALDAP